MNPRGGDDMGRMLDVLRLAEKERDGDGGTPPVPEDEHFVSDFANEEVPFIEVGPAHSMEASPAVLAAPPRLRIAPRPPADAGPLLDPGPVPSAPGVCLRPLPAGLGLLPPERRFARELVAFHHPETAGAEYRQLAAALRHDAGPSRVLLCAGVAPGAGTTGVVLNLAVCLAGPEGLRVVVVDADEARPAVADRLGLRGRPGLAEVLDGGESLDRALQETGFPRLTALTAGRPSRDREAFAVAEVCRPVLRQLRDRFDVVLIDAGTDEVGLGRACDAAYLVAPHAEADAAATVERARALLGQGAPLRGCVLTGR
jgi:Mrp family chromosome partitioning ATPase